MKHFAKRLALMLAALMLLLCFTGCGAKSPVAISFGATEFTANMYSYWLSTYKAAFLYSMTGQTTDNIQYWQMEIGEGVTYGDYLGAMAASEIMVKAVCHELFNTYGLALTAEEEAQLDDRIVTLEQKVGSRSALNSVLSAYGINADILREINEIDFKVQKLQQHLFGEGGEQAPTAEEIDAFYNQNYYRTKYIFLSTQFEYERDENGALILDEETQAYKTRELSASETKAKEELADDLDKRIAAGEDFDKLVLEYSMDTGMQKFSDGYYFTTASTFMTPDVMSAVMGMEIGAMKTIENDNGIFIIKRYELQSKKYDDTEYKPYMFADLAANVGTVKLQSMVSGYADSVVVNDTVIANYPFATVTPNFYY